jgi:release factor glutamine methyltransferase
VVERFRAAVDRRSAGEPYAYVVGRAAFRTLDLMVDSRVLIPRPETEELVGRVLNWAAARWGDGPWGAALDVGTGSGCIALSLEVEGRFRRVVGVDVSPLALQVARANGDVLTRGRVDFGIANVFPDDAAAYDVVVSNPPYLTAAEWETLDPGVRDYEPRLALVSGMDGLEHARVILNGARDRLKSGGLLGIELDSGRAGRVLGLAVEAGFRNARIERDPFGRPRYLLATKKTA